MWASRLRSELAKISLECRRGISCERLDGDEAGNRLVATLSGPDASPYAGGEFVLDITVPERYPFVPPSITFRTKIYHPNVDTQGRICLDLLKSPPLGEWKPTYTLEGLLIAIQSLLEAPNPDDPLMPEIASEFLSWREEFEKKAKKFTTLHAVPKYKLKDNSA